MSSLVIIVPRSRKYCGRAVLLGDDGAARLGPLRVLASASARVGRKHDNEGCDPLRRFGHTPTGSYVVSGSLPPGFAHPRRPSRFGQVGAILLEPRSGDALESMANGRRLFALHGGPLDPARRLRPTRGGLRMSDGDLTALALAINAALAAGDPLDKVVLMEAADVDIQSVPPLDLRGARQQLGFVGGVRGGKGAARLGKTTPTTGLLLLALGVRLGEDGGKKLERREMLQAALVLVGGLMAGACSNGRSPCTPLACDPGDGGFGDDGGDSTDGAADDAGTGKRKHHCPPSGYVCEQTDPGYVSAGGGVG